MENSFGQFDHGKSKNCGANTLWSNLKAPGPKTFEGAKFQRHKFEISTKSTISIILGSNKIDREESENRNFVTLGSLLKGPGLKATIKKVKISKAR